MKQILSAIFLLFFTATAQANPVFETYIQWIVDHSELEYNGEPLPTIRVVTEQQIVIMAYGEETVTTANNRGRSLPGIVALYDHEFNQLIVPDTLDLADWNNHHVIVHELVHYLQDINGYYQLPEFVVCRVGLEELAYNLHVQWMDEVDHPAQRPDGLFLALLLSSCSGIHP